MSNLVGRNDCEDTFVEGTEALVNCRARIFSPSNLVECNTRVHACRWHFNFGEGAFCNHPSSSKIAKGLLNGWSI